MERILKILIGVVVLILLAVWLSSSFKSCGSSAGESAEITTDSEELGDDFYDDEINTIPENTSEAKEEPVTTTDYTEVDEIYNEPEEKKPVARKPVVKKKSPTTPRPKRTTSSSTYDKYLLLAGSYLVKDNADNMVEKLRKLGYNNAEVAVFNDSQYYSVIAARYQSYNSAQQASSKLNRRGINNYVHKRQE